MSVGIGDAALLKGSGGAHAKEQEIPPHDIPNEWACYLCEQVCRDASKSWFSLARILCWHCERVTHGDRSKMGFIRRAGNHGCPWVNSRDRHYYWAFHKPK